MIAMVVMYVHNSPIRTLHDNQWSLQGAFDEISHVTYMSTVIHYGQYTPICGTVLGHPESVHCMLPLGGILVR